MTKIGNYVIIIKYWVSGVSQYVACCWFLVTYSDPPMYQTHGCGNFESGTNVKITALDIKYIACADKI